MKSKEYLFIVAAALLTLLNSTTFAQQNIQFTQYMFNGLVINPAYAGADEALSLTFVQRSQWTGVPGAPSTQTLTAHSLFMKKHIGLGVTLVNDKIGAHKNFTALTNYAYHISTGRSSYLSLGIQAGINNRRSDYASLAGSNDPKLQNPLISHTFLDFGAGLYFRSEKLDAGFSVPQLGRQRYNMNDSVTLDFTNTSYLLFSRYRISVNEHIDFEPGMLIKFRQDIPLSYDINLNMIYRKVLVAGLSYRKKESLDMLVKAQITQQLQFGYSYDHPIGVIAQLGNGSHELMIQYVFRYAERNVTSPR
jgi:type IX secretion system PorP/SprF family membrane protein